MERQKIVKYRRTIYPEKTFDYDGIDLRYVDTEEGEPLFFIHGLGGRIEDNDLIFPYLDRKYRIICPDQPGSGFSAKPDMEYSVHSVAEFVLDFASRLGIEKMKLAGGSQGGLLTLLCCTLAPERIEKAVVYSPAGVWPPNPLLARFLHALPPAGVRPFLHVTSLFWNSPSFPGYWEERSRAMDYFDNTELPGYGRHVLGCAASQFETDFREVFASVTVSTLIFWGLHDFGMPVAQGRTLHRLIPGSRFIEVPAAGHNVFSEKPEFCAEKVIEFLSE